MGLITTLQCYSSQQALSSLLLQIKENRTQEPVFTSSCVWHFLLDMDTCIWESTPAGQSEMATSQMPSALSNTWRFPLPFFMPKMHSSHRRYDLFTSCMLFPCSVIYCDYMWPDTKNFSSLLTADNTLLLLHTPAAPRAWHVIRAHNARNRKSPTFSLQKGNCTSNAFSISHIATAAATAKGYGKHLFTKPVTVVKKGQTTWVPSTGTVAVFCFHLTFFIPFSNSSGLNPFKKFFTF